MVLPELGQPNSGRSYCLSIEKCRSRGLHSLARYSWWLREIIAAMQSNQKIAPARPLPDPNSASPRRHAAIVLLGVILSVMGGLARAQSCELRSSQIQFVQENLKRASTEGDLASAQDFADRTRRGLDQLAITATRCGCGPAQAKFEGAAAQVRLVTDVETRKALREILARVVPLLDEAIAEFRKCAKR